jgi:hypothetical protein
MKKTKNGKKKEFNYRQSLLNSRFSYIIRWTFVPIARLISRDDMAQSDNQIENKSNELSIFSKNWG